MFLLIIGRIFKVVWVLVPSPPPPQNLSMCMYTRLWWKFCPVLIQKFSSCIFLFEGQNCHSYQSCDLVRHSERWTCFWIWKSFAFFSLPQALTASAVLTAWEPWSFRLFPVDFVFELLKLKSLFWSYLLSW